MISIEHAFVFVNRNTEQMFDISRKFILLMLSDHVLIMCKSYFPITFYQQACPISCTFSIKKTTDMHLCDLHISGSELGDMKLGLYHEIMFLSPMG
jgi:hypothetical protein